MKSGFVFFLLIISGISFGQSRRPTKHNHPSGKQHLVSTGVLLPLGNFSSTHMIGATAGYSWSYHRFGGMDVKPVKPVGFTAGAGAAWYFEEKRIISGYPYRYPKYIFFHAFAGAVYNPWRRGNISLTAGPALGIYDGHTQFNIGSCLEGSYYMHEKIAISPGIIFMKESGADALWSFSLKAAMVF